jgi:hypothetical protein
MFFYSWFVSYHHFGIFPSAPKLLISWFNCLDSPDCLWSLQMPPILPNAPEPPKCSWSPKLPLILPNAPDLPNAPVHPECSWSSLRLLSYQRPLFLYDAPDSPKPLILPSGPIPPKCPWSSQRLWSYQRPLFLRRPWFSKAPAPLYAPVPPKYSLSPISAPAWSFQTPLFFPNAVEIPARAPDIWLYVSVALYCQ